MPLNFYIYYRVEPGGGAALMRAVVEYRIRQFLEPGSQRHTECFVV